MKRLHRIYIFSLYGALGGLIGSFLHQYFLLDTLSGQLDPAMRFGFLALLGALVGIPIGFFPSFAEGKGNYSLRGATRAGLIGGIFGGIGGLIALPLAELIHVQIGGGLKGRILALGLLGLAVGIAEGIVGGARPWRGLIGGLIGGVIAGAALESLLPYQTTHADIGILALISIGFFIALFIALFINVLSAAWLEGQVGSKVEGQIYHLSKFRDPFQAFLGSDKKGMVFIWIPDALPRHASISLTQGGARLRHVGTSGETRVNGNPVRERMLRDGDMIEIGHSKLKYRERRRATLAPATNVVAKARVA